MEIPAIPDPIQSRYVPRARFPQKAQVPENSPVEPPKLIDDIIVDQLKAGGMNQDRALTNGVRMANEVRMAGGGDPNFEIPTEENIRRSRELTTKPVERSLAQRILGGIEAAGTLGTAALMDLPAKLYAIGTSRGKTREQMEQEYRDFLARNMYVPRTEAGAESLENIAQFLGPLGSLPPVAQIGPGVALAQPAMRQATQAAGKGLERAGMAAERVAEQQVPKIMERGGLPAEILQGMTEGTTSKVIKPTGGNWPKGGLDRALERFGSVTIAGETPAERLPRHEQLLRDPTLTPESRQTVERHLNATRQEVALDNWIEGNLQNYIKKQMGTPEDPIRRLAEQGITHLNQDQIDEGTQVAIPRLRASQGFPAQGMATSPIATSWEALSDLAIGLPSEYYPTQNNAFPRQSPRIRTAGDVQTALRLLPEQQKAERQFLSTRDEIKRQFKEKLESSGIYSDNEAHLLSEKTPIKDQAKMVGRAEELEKLYKDYVSLRQQLNADDYAIARNNPWIEKADPQTKLYGANIEDLGFDHIVDVLREDLATGRIRPEQLNKVSMEQAVRRTYEYDQELAAKMNAARMAARKDLPVYKEYPEKFRWVQLNKPGSFADESNAMGHSVRGYEPPRGHPDWVEASGDSGSLSYGHGGWEAIKSGKAKVYSLIDEKGEPHVTVEVNRSRKLPMNASEFYQSKDVPESLLKKIDEAEKAGDLSDIGSFEFLVENSPEYKAYVHNLPNVSSITQIKGKQNRAPKEEYLPFVQDFVKNGNWGSVGDFTNTGLIKIDAESDLAAAFKKLGKEPPSFVNQDELTNLLKWHRGEGDLPEGFKQGGEVKMQAGRLAESSYARGGTVVRAAEAAKKAKKPPALPIELPRAPAMSRQELNEEAERVGRQIIGEHVRKPGSTENLADYSMKEAERLRAMREGEDYVLRNILKVPEPAVMTPRSGQIVMGLPGDISVADKELMMLGGLPIKSRQEGGPRYGMRFANLPEEERQFWASNFGPADIFQNKATLLGELFPDADVLAAYMSMGREGTNFAQHFADANLKAIRAAIATGQVKESDIAAFNDAIKKGIIKRNPKTGEKYAIEFPEFVGVENTRKAYNQMMENPELRKHFNDRMKTGKETAPRGLPSGVDIEWAISEPNLRNLEKNLVGFSVGQLRPGASLIDPIAHKTYSHGIPGTAIGRFPGHVPMRLAFPDAYAHIAATKRPADVTGTMQKTFPHQIVDQQWEDQIGQYLQTLKSITGKKKGGLAEVNKAKGGRIAKAAATAARKVNLPVEGLSREESQANLAKFLEGSATQQRLYHATPKDFSEFIPGGFNPERSGSAIWMTPDKEFQPAAHNIRVIPDKPGYMYGSSSDKFTPGTNVMPLYSAIKNPLIAREETWKTDFQRFGGSPWTLTKEEVAKIKAAGHDGIMYYDSKGNLAEVVAFEPEQVKSAIGNRGTYDVSERDITKAKGGLAAVKRK